MNRRNKNMTILEKALNAIQELSLEQQQQALNFIEYLAFNSSDQQVEEIRKASFLSDQPDISCYDLSKEWIGIANDLPDDLSTNKKYMEGYGT